MLSIGCRSGRSSGWYGHEPSISEILSDSIVKAMMRADGVDPKLLERDLRRMAVTVQGSARTPEIEIG
jgi:hypothetical protein